MRTPKGKEKRIIVLILIVLVLLTVFVSEILARKSNNDYEVVGDTAYRMSSTVRSMCVKIHTSTDEGSGTVWDIDDEQVIIVTSLHVVQNWNEESYITFSNSQKTFGQVFGADEQLDLCFISVPAEYLDNDILESITQDISIVRNASNSMAINEVDSTANDVNGNISDNEISIITFDLYSANNTYKLSNKKVSDKHDKMSVDGEIIFGRTSLEKTYLYDMDRVMLIATLDERNATPGMSGAGVFTVDGEFIGIINAGNDNHTVAISDVNDIKNALVGIPY